MWSLSEILFAELGGKKKSVRGLPCKLDCKERTIPYASEAPVAI